MAEIALDRLTKVYPDGTNAVSELDLQVDDAELMVFVGPSGCGKTTALRMVAGLEDITAGSGGIGGRVVNKLPPKDRDVAMVFQNYALYPHMSAYDNMAFGLKMRSFPKDEIGRRVNDAARVLGLETILKKKPRTLSGGQRQSGAGCGGGRGGGWRWAARSPGSRRRSSWTSRCRTSTRSSGSRCAPRSPG